jgi:hypothetical protein
MRLNKLENGQFEIGLGTNANVPPDVEAQADANESVRREESRGRRRRGGRGGERGRAPEERARVAEEPAPEPEEHVPGGLTLSDGFALMREALQDLGAVGDEATDADQVRERMIERHANAGDALFVDRRFQRFLRQAHDAGAIDLAKTEDGVYLLKLRPETAAPEAAGHPEAADGEERGEHRRRGTRGGRGRRRGGRPRDEEGGAEEPRRPAPEPFEAAPVRAAAPPAPRGEEAHRNPRFRRGSRGPAGGPPPAPRPESVPEPTHGADAPAGSGTVEHNRSLRGRRGRRGPGGHPGGTAPAAPEGMPGPAPEPQRAPPPPPPRPRLDEEAAVRAMAEIRPAPERQDEEPSAEGGSLFKRMSAALQRAMGQPKDEPREP